MLADQPAGPPTLQSQGKTSAWGWQGIKAQEGLPKLVCLGLTLTQGSLALRAESRVPERVRRDLLPREGKGCPRVAVGWLAGIPRRGCASAIRAVAAQRALAQSLTLGLSISAWRTVWAQELGAASGLGVGTGWSVEGAH